MSNLSSTPVKISAGQVIGDLEAVQLADQETQEEYSTQKDFLAMFSFEETNLSTDQIQKVEQLLVSFADIFSANDFDIGHVKDVTHRIDLHNEVPFKERHRRIPPAMYDEVRKHIQDLLQTDVITPSYSPWASPVVLVRKKDGSIRMCVDYRKLNSQTRKDSYALPRIEEIMDILICA